MKQIGLVLLSGALLVGCAQTRAQSPSASQAVPLVRTNALAELPHWPLGLKNPPEITFQKPSKLSDKADILVWTAPGAQHIRALLVVPNNSDSKDWTMHGAVRRVCTQREVGIVYLRNFPGEYFEYTDRPVETNKLQAVLNAVAAETGIAEFRYAPWIALGKSSRGKFPFRLAWLFPERTIATIDYHGETPTWPLPDWAAKQDQSILHVNANGEAEWDRTWYRHVRPSLLNYRARTSWLPHQVAAPGIGHGNYPDATGPNWGKPVPPGVTSIVAVWDYLALFVDKAIALRVPTDKYPTDRPTTLKTVDPDSGYLIHPRAIEEIQGLKWRPLRQTDGLYSIIDHIKEPGEQFDPNPGAVARPLLVRRATEVPAAERCGLFWVADKEQADAWVKLHTVEKPVP